MKRGRTLVGCVLALSFVQAGCSDPRKPGDACFESSECGGGTDCVQTTIGRFCFLPCEATDVFCEEGEVCIQSDEDPSLYYCNNGGDIEKGDDCEVTVECELGTLCVFNDQGTPDPDDDDTECEVACKPGTAMPCDDDDVCIPLDGFEEDRGFCRDPN